MAILDQFGNPIKARQTDLKEAQTSRLASLHQEFATHPVRGLTPRKLASILEQAEQGNIIEQHNLFLDIEEKDAHVFAEMSKRRRVLLGLEYSIEPPPNADKKEEANAEFLKEVITDIPDVEDIILDATDGIGHGFSCLEMEWQRNQNIWLPDNVEHRPQSWFTLDRETRTELRLRDMSTDGEQLQPFTWIVHTHRAKPGYITRAGLHRVLAWPFVFKAFSIRDLAEFLEIYGLPMRLGKYQSGADDNEKATLMRAVAGIGHAAAGIIPQGMEIEFTEAAKGQSDPFMAMINWAEASQSKAILGGDLSSTAKATGMGSGVADLQGEVRNDLRDSDARQIEGSLTRDMLYPILALNGKADNPHRCPRLKFETADPEDLDAKSKRDKTIFDMGFKPSAKYINETYGGDWTEIKKTNPKEETSTAAAKAQSTPKTGTSTKPEPDDVQGSTSVAGAGSAGATTVDLMTNRLEAETAPVIEQTLNDIRQLMAEMEEAGESLEALPDRLMALYDYLEPDQMAKRIQLALAAAELAGMNAVENP